MTQQTMLTIKNKSEVLYLRQDNILFIQSSACRKAFLFQPHRISVYIACNVDFIHGSSLLL
jgi:hypothetical protein